MSIIFCLVLFALLAAVAFATIPETDKGFDIDVMVEALRQVENWNGHARGAAGERGPWQITPAVWAQFSDKPFSWAEGKSPEERVEQRRTAREYVYWILGRLKSAHFDQNAFMVALVWNAGWNSVFYWHPTRPSRAKRTYADRAANIYYDISKPKDAEATPESLFKIKKSDTPEQTTLPSQRP